MYKRQVKIIDDADIIINVVDATNLERNLFLTLQLLKKKIPMVVALNLWDEARHVGIEIDVKKLEHMLGVSVVPTVAVTGEGVKNLAESLKTACKARCKARNIWGEIGKIVKEVQRIRFKHHTKKEIIEDLTIKPLTGIPIAIAILVLTFYLIRYIGEGMISFILDPFFENFYMPVLNMLSKILGKGFLHDILIGTLINGEIDFVQSMGLLSTGLYVPFAMVLPYVFAFYLALGLLEDSGYLPRLATLIDSIMHKLGMHGLAIIPMLLGLGCNVPGALATRVLETEKQRFIAVTLMAIAVPCMAQTAMIFGLVGKSVFALSTVFLTLFFVWIVIGLLLRFIIKGESREIIVEIPPYRIPYLNAVLKKLWMRLRYFLVEAIPYVLLGVFIVNLFYFSGIMEIIGNITAPLMVNLLGLPKQAILALIVGFLRKDVAVGMLLPLSLTIKQSIIASVVLAMYFPCIATFVVIFKDLGLKGLLKSIIVMLCFTFLVGGLLNVLV